MKFQPTYICPACGEPYEADWLIDNDHIVDLLWLWNNSKWTCSGCGDAINLRGVTTWKELGEAYMVRMSKSWRKQELKPKGGSNEFA